MAGRFVEVPHEQIELSALRRLIEEFIERDGTFYGEVELSMDEKVDMVIEQLKSGEAVITWDLYLESSNIVLKRDLKR